MPPLAALLAESAMFRPRRRRVDSHSTAPMATSNAIKPAPTPIPAEAPALRCSPDGVGEGTFVADVVAGRVIEDDEVWVYPVEGIEKYSTSYSSGGASKLSSDRLWQSPPLGVFAQHIQRFLLARRDPGNASPYTRPGKSQKVLIRSPGGSIGRC
ncbi:hypothetical protein PG989_016340 [Apiospora arundinis]